MSETNERIYSYITKTTFIHFEDSTRIGKLRVFAGKYKKGQGADNMLAHFIDIPAARPFLHDMQWAKPIEYKEFKGSANGTVISRTLKINTAEKGYYIELTSGPGKATATGAILPAGKPETSVSVLIPFTDARMLAADLLEYLLAVRAVDVLAQALARAKNDKDRPADTATNGADEFEKAFPRDAPTPAEDAKLHKFKYTNGKEAPDHEKTRAIYSAYFMANRQRPKDGEALCNWWKEARPTDDAPAEA